MMLPTLSRVYEYRISCLPKLLALSQLLLSYSVWAAPHILRIREGTPAGTVLIPDIIEFLSGGSGSAHQSPGSASTTEGLLLAIGNAVMPSASWLTINPSRGSLLVKTAPDRDALCPTEFKFPETAIAIDRGGVEFQDYIHSSNGLSRGGIDPGDCVLEVSLVHGSPSNPSFDMLNIVLEDVNDHPPTFSVNGQSDSDKMEYVIKIRESSQLLSPHPIDSNPHELHFSSDLRIPLPLAKDPDYGPNSIRGYRLEGQDAYLFRLEVGVPANGYSGTSPELQYTKSALYSQTKSSQLWLVPVDARTGRTSTSNNHVILDREEREVYHFVLVAFDGGSPQRTGRLPIRLVVEDANDNAPKFNQAWYSGKLSEGDLPGHIVFEFSAHDVDGAGGNSLIGFRIPGQPDPGNGLSAGLAGKKVESTAGLSDAQIAAANYFAVEIMALDMTGSGTAIHASKRLNATYGRLIVRRQSKEKVRKAASRALEIARKQMTSGSNKRMVQDSYPTTALNTPANYEEGARLEFVIEAFDHGEPVALSSRVPVYIQITEVNDHAPNIFVSYLREAEQLGRPVHNAPGGSSAWGKVRENLGRAMLAQVTVTDEDTLYAETDIVCNTNDSRFTLEEIAPIGQFNDLSGPWTRRNVRMSDQPRKQTDSSHSEDPTVQKIQTRIRRAILPTKMYKLMLNAPLDRESSSVHQMTAAVQFTLTCTDNARGQLPGGQLTTTATIRIIIEDANDNAPVFEQTHYTFRVPENHPSMKPSEMGAVRDRYLIGRIHATDADEGWNAALEYQLLSNPSSSLELERLTGQLYVTRPFDRESISEVVFQVIAVDCVPEGESKLPAMATESRLTGTAEVRLIIEDLNDSPPVFQEMNYHFEVEEGIDLIKVGQVWATDADQDEFGRITYRLAVGPGSRFQDQIGSEQSSLRSMPNQLYDEALEINTHFQIDPTSGVIHLKGRLDRERRAHYEFVVLAVDNPRSIAPKLDGMHRSKLSEAVQFTGTATVLITVLDQNDNAPRILSPRNHAQFSLGPDQLIAGNTVFTIRATDPDLGENGTIEYSLLSVEDDLGSWSGTISTGDTVKESGNTTGMQHKRVGTTSANKSVTEYPFSVDQTAGICYLRENLPPLDADGPRAYLLRMRAYDLGRPQSLNTSLTVRVVRQAFGSSESGSLHDGVSEQRNGFADIPFRGYSQSSGQNSGDGKLGTWTGAGQTRISDRTMVVILSTVFVLLLLTTIVLLLLVRYRRLFLRNISFSSTHSGDSSIGKPNAGKQFTGHPGLHSSHGLFTEVLSAPWVNTSSSPIDSPNSFTYPTIYNTSNSVLMEDPNRGYMKNPGACWSPPGMGTCKSPAEFRRLLVNENQTPVFHTPPTRTPCPTGYDLEMLPRSQIQVQSRRVEPSNETSFVEVPRTFVLENYPLPETSDGDYRALTMDTRAQKYSNQNNRKNSRLMTFDSGLLLPNAWAKMSSAHTSSQVPHGQSMISRVVSSLDDLTDNTGADSQEYKTIAPINSNNRNQPDKKPRSRNEYQVLSAAIGLSPGDSDIPDQAEPMSDSQNVSMSTTASMNEPGRTEKQSEFCSLLNSLLSKPKESIHDFEQPRHSLPDATEQTNQTSIRNMDTNESSRKPTHLRSNLKGRKTSSSNSAGSPATTSMVTFETAPPMDRIAPTQIHHNLNYSKGISDYKSAEKVSPRKTRFTELPTSHPGSPIKSANVKGSFV